MFHGTLVAIELYYMGPEGIGGDPLAQAALESKDRTFSGSTRTWAVVLGYVVRCGSP